jgi:hypothetical protein
MPRCISHMEELGIDFKAKSSRICVASFDVTRKVRKYYDMNQFYIKNASPTQLSDLVGMK